ncbi:MULTISPECIES: hypothetical protein [unclassified Mesorhizobium]|uniref:hypothetical protein n=1 Tax=unclassified Mesorhizobium TaxID=325217 RepID=UPI000F75CAF4|nr:MULTISPECIES: hypothetical protein [unclassified Mesorhizobium]AZO21670.1 hypothetical protein EJ070_13945 [Mesorhizobium sp. M1E.F.Ca.ET.045.02.1.1]RUW23357.1 hypothetical protein EOA38_30040 [Mesorhizobium sp. M1E.F.Ca.ET.041.01.1.1]RUW71987.1 hypothetical protein EOA29_33910 [Mesorhizobium sp. M1E.F.Ca.ET.063.01.1.1]RWB52488.1 MAG: hypothetical protein EOQ47_25335 [Mesorhizobium sp.]RWD78158.1 MAG: hypothetical protein EOS38_33555 [Mesorhizobium sp.]
MDSTGWMHLGVLLLVFAVVAGFALRKMFLPAPKEPPHGETVAGASGYGGGGSFDAGSGHSGSGQ